MHATALLRSPADFEPVPIIVLWGEDRFLKQGALEAIAKRVLGDDDEELGLSRHNGQTADVTTVLDDLLTVSMWGDRRLIVVDDAEDFVSKNRAAIEKYLERPSKKSVLALFVKAWPKNTRLYKTVAKIGADVECGELKGAELLKWVTAAAKERHGKVIDRDAANLLTELAGGDLGLLTQELDKLASFLGERGRIDAEDVRKLVGGWKAEITWNMTNAVIAGNLGSALACLDKLLLAGEAPQKLLGGIQYVFRKLATATELARQGQSLPGALSQAGVFPRDTGAAQQYLRRLGRPKAERIAERLLTAEQGLKGNSGFTDRLQLENLLVELTGRA